MNSQPSPKQSPPSTWRLRPVAVGLLCVTGGISLLAFAGGTQPDPPVPLDRPMLLAASTKAAAAADREPDCRCGVLHARDIESRIEGHVERWEAMSRGAQPARAEPRRSGALHMTSLVEGVVGFPVRQYRLAADVDEADDGAGND
jgi:hypothetical protein